MMLPYTRRHSAGMPPGGVAGRGVFRRLGRAFAQEAS